MPQDHVLIIKAPIKPNISNPSTLSLRSQKTLICLEFFEVSAFICQSRAGSNQSRPYTACKPISDHSCRECSASPGRAKGAPEP